MNNFGANLKKLREERNIKVSMLSEMTGIARSTIYAWEKGERPPASFSSRKLLADFFNVDPFYFDQISKLEEDPLIKEILMRITILERDVHNGHALNGKDEENENN